MSHHAVLKGLGPESQLVWKNALAGQVYGDTIWGRREGYLYGRSLVLERINIYWRAMQLIYFFNPLTGLIRNLALYDSFITLLKWPYKKITC